MPPTPAQPSNRVPLSEAHTRLGAELRRVRQAARLTTREMSGYSSGHISNVENGYVTPSRELIELYGQLGGDRRRLLSLYDGMSATMATRKQERRREQRGTITKSDATAESTYEEILATYAVQDSENVFRLDGRGVLAQLTCIMRVKPVAAPLRYVACSHVYIADRRPGVVSIEAGTGCRIVQKNENASGVVKCVFQLDREVAAEDAPYLYSYHVLVNSDKRMEPPLRQSYKEHRTRQAWQLQFTEPAMPERIWWFRSKELMATVMDPDETQLFALDPRGFYFHEFFDLEDELAGIGWNWKN